jgi:hypothetical protein
VLTSQAVPLILIVAFERAITEDKPVTVDPDFVTPPPLVKSKPSAFADKTVEARIATESKIFFIMVSVEINKMMKEINSCSQ